MVFISHGNFKLFYAYRSTFFFFLKCYYSRDTRHWVQIWCAKIGWKQYVHNLFIEYRSHLNGASCVRYKKLFKFFVMTFNRNISFKAPNNFAFLFSLFCVHCLSPTHFLLNYVESNTFFQFFLYTFLISWNEVYDSKWNEHNISVEQKDQNFMFNK